MFRSIRPLIVVTSLILSSTAMAGELEDRAEQVLAKAITVAASGDLDKWITDFCDPERCHTQQSKEQWKAYQLKQLATQGKHCLVDDKVTVTRWRGDLSQAPHKAKAYVQCTNRQLPPPVEFRYDEAANKIWIRNVSI